MRPRSLSAESAALIPLLARRPGLTLALLAAGATLALVASISVGSAGPSPAMLWRGVLAGTDPLAHALVVTLRLPRALTAFGAGALLALAGVCMQVLLRNPLADPYVLGLSGGAAVAALGAMQLGLGAFGIHTAAFLGALAATLTVFALAQGPGGWTPTRLLLTGVVVAAGMVFWLMGDLAWADSPVGLLVLTAIAIPAGIVAARPLNVLARGDVQARLLGVEVTPLRGALFVVASLLTAATVTSVGAIGFVGLVTPHLVRLALGSDHRRVVPAAALAGGTLVVIADLIARTLLAPRQLPVGALTALVGVPLFLVLMRRAQTAT